jgi:hypothetical protein
VSDIRIEQWDDSNKRWAQLVELLEREDQLCWILPEDGPLRPDAHVFVALQADAVVGFLAFIVQEIGPRVSPAGTDGGKGARIRRP